jgi:hypothetical protein
MSEALKRCPFCGGKGTLEFSYWADIVKHYWIICCNRKCGINPKTKIYTEKRKAVAAWNKRVIEEARNE